MKYTVSIFRDEDICFSKTFISTYLKVHTASQSRRTTLRSVILHFFLVEYFFHTKGNLQTINKTCYLMYISTEQNKLTYNLWQHTSIIIEPPYINETFRLLSLELCDVVQDGFRQRFSAGTNIHCSAWLLTFQCFSTLLGSNGYCCTRFKQIITCNWVAVHWRTICVTVQSVWQDCDANICVKEYSQMLWKFCFNKKTMQIIAYFPFTWKYFLLCSHSI